MTPAVQRWFDGTDWTEHTRPLPEAKLRRSPAVPAQPARTAVVGDGAAASWLPAQAGAWVPGDAVDEPVTAAVNSGAGWGASGGPGAPGGLGAVGGFGAAGAFGATGGYGATGGFGAAGGYGATGGFGAAGAVPVPGGWGAAPAAGAWAPPSGAPAHWGWRVLATLLDQLLTTTPYVAGAVYLQLTSVPGLDAFGQPTPLPTAAGGLAFGLGALISFVLWLVCRVVQQGRTGQSWGKRIVGLRTVHETTQEPLGMWWAFVRDVAHVVNAFVFYLGYLWPLWDARRQAFSDKLTHAVVLRDPS